MGLYHLTANDIVRTMDSYLPEMSTKKGRNILIYERERVLAIEIPTQTLQSKVDTFYQDQTKLSSLALKLRLKKAPPRIRAFQEELTERLKNLA
ncbi:hypothetical protein GOV12_05740 [Candidatus Pacearchaeota archaeon]|nr:hypothetical protein [Candidatus Pacearchaeota archaeon]